MGGHRGDGFNLSLKIVLLPLSKSFRGSIDRHIYLFNSYPPRCGCGDCVRRRLLKTKANTQPPLLRGLRLWSISLRTTGRGTVEATVRFLSCSVRALPCFSVLTSSSSTHCVPSVKSKPSATISTYVAIVDEGPHTQRTKKRAIFSAWSQRQTLLENPRCSSTRTIFQCRFFLSNFVCGSLHFATPCTHDVIDELFTGLAWLGLPLLPEE